MSKQATEMKKRNDSPELTGVNPEPQAIEALAYQMWIERGCPIGSDREDWLRAEEALRKALSIQQAA